MFSLFIVIAIFVQDDVFLLYYMKPQKKSSSLNGRAGH